MNRGKLFSNERSEGSEVITEMNILFSKFDFKMKVAIGELSLRSKNAQDKRNDTLFPDAIIFSDTNRLEPLIGWEFKMPEVSISNQEFYNNARDKANRMGTKVFVLWNFQYASVYINTTGMWPEQGNPTYFYDEFSKILIDRNSIHSNSDLWKKQLKKILEDLSYDIEAKKFDSAPIEFNIGSYIETISDILTPLLSDFFYNSKDILFKTYMRKWRDTEQAELQYVKSKETDLDVSNAYARNVIIRWINRFIFAHILKRQYIGINDSLVDFSEDKNLNNLAIALNRLVDTTDFYTIFHVTDYETNMPKKVIESLNEFNRFLNTTNLSDVDSVFVSKLLENIIEISKRELMGLYTTPIPLANLLVGITMQKAEGNFADVTTGSGTIARAVQQRLRKFNQSEKYIHEHVWASDRYNFPLQIANLNLTTLNSLNLKNIVYQQNALQLSVDQLVEIVDPLSGEKQQLSIPKFDYIVSNLPFISSNYISEEDKNLSKPIINKFEGLNEKSDLYQLIIMKLSDLLVDSENSRIGVITSNSWTNIKKNYRSFYNVLIQKFHVEMIIMPEESRWFKNAEVVATIIILSIKEFKKNNNTRFIRIPKNFEEFVPEIIDDVLSEEKNPQHYMETINTESEILDKLSMGLSIESMFNNQHWIKSIKQNLISFSHFVEGGRGTRTGRDKLFITTNQKTNSIDSVPFLKNAKEINSFEVKKTTHYYFYTIDSLDVIKSDNRLKTIEYINSISSTPEAIKQKEKHGEQWFSAEQAPQFADFATTINPEKRFFWARMIPRAAVNQRVTAFRVIEQYREDTELLHAILNSIVSQYMLAGSGFGRALGATDLTSDGIKQMYILDITQLNANQKASIITAWSRVKSKSILSIFDQIEDEEWISFNKSVLASFNIDANVYYQISDDLISLVRRRISAKY